MNCGCKRVVKGFASVKVGTVHSGPHIVYVQKVISRNDRFYTRIKLVVQLKILCYHEHTNLFAIKCIDDNFKPL